MTTPTDATIPEDTQKTWKRRGLFAAAWAAVAAVVVRNTTQPVEAAQSNLTYASNDVTTRYGNGPTTPVYIQTGSPFSTFFEQSAVQVYSFASGVDAITGDASLVNFAGRHGIVGAANGSNGYGVYGQLKGTTNGIAMFAVNGSTFKGAVPGGGGWGIYGASQNGHAFVGASSTAGASGMVGSNNNVAGAYAASFYGPTVVVGDFAVTGAKSAAVPHPDGTHRRLYAVESPENWFEDFGNGQLECGVADVTIDPDFAAVTHLDDYHVFLTTYDEPELLAVAKRSPTGFRVKTTNSVSAARFSWRIVAKRKDIAAPRFETVIVPPAPVIPPMPDLHADAPHPARPGETVRRATGH